MLFLRTLAVVVALMAATTACSDPDGPGSAAVDPGEGLHPFDWAEAQIACMQEEGFEATMHFDGSGVRYAEVPEEQATALGAAADSCLERYQIAPAYLEPFDEAQLRWLYEWYTTVSIPCLEAEGYSGFQPPTLEVFIDTYGHDDVRGWTPYIDLLDRIDPETLPQEVELRCPQNADPDDLLNARGS